MAINSKAKGKRGELAAFLRRIRVYRPPHGAVLRQ